MPRREGIIALACIIAIMAIVFSVSASPAFEDLQEDNARRIVSELLHGGNADTIRVLYLGNSRVARHTGYAYDGVEEIIFEQGRLAGNGFSVPLRQVGQLPEDQIFLRNSGFGNTFTTEEWKANDSRYMRHSHGGREGLLLIPRREYQMAYFENGIPLLPKNKPVVLTVQYLLGDSLGEFDVTPVEVSNSGEIIYRHRSVRINSDMNSFPLTSARGDSLGERIMFRHIVIPAMANEELNRAFLLTGFSGESVVYRVNAIREIAEGIAISEMAIGGMGYGEQSSPGQLSALDWTNYARAYNPDIAIWQFAANGEDVETALQGSKKLMDRVESANGNVLHIIVIDTPSPEPNYMERINKSREWAAALEGYHGAIVIDPNPFLPPEFLETAGQGEKGWGIYFNDNIHETRLGARIVTNAVWDGLQRWLDEN